MKAYAGNRDDESNGIEYNDVEILCNEYELELLINGLIKLKKEIDEHYKKGNVKYKKFIEKLQKDKSYPYSQSELTRLSLSVDLFNQSAFIIEDDLKILETGINNKRLIYLLLRKVIDDGNFSFIIEHVMGLSKESKENKENKLQYIK